MVPKLRAGFIGLHNRLTEITQSSNNVLEDNERLRKEVDTLTKQNQELLSENSHIASEVITLKQENKDLVSRIEVLANESASGLESTDLSSTSSEAGI